MPLIDSNLPESHYRAKNSLFPFHNFASNWTWTLGYPDVDVQGLDGFSNFWEEGLISYDLLLHIFFSTTELYAELRFFLWNGIESSIIKLCL